MCVCVLYALFTSSIRKVRIKDLLQNTLSKLVVLIEDFLNKIMEKFYFSKHNITYVFTDVSIYFKINVGLND